MQQYLEGDSRAFRTLMERHSAKVYNFLIRSSGRRDLADDLLQEVFMRIVKRAESFRGQAKFTTWMYTIARNLIIDTARRERHRRTVALDAPVRGGEPPAPDPPGSNRFRALLLRTYNPATSLNLNSRVRCASSANPKKDEGYLRRTWA